MQKKQWTRNGKSSRRYQHGIWKKVQSKKEVILEAQRDKKKVHLATLMAICHLKNGELEPKITEGQRQSRAPRCQCERRLWSLCSLYWTRLVCITNDGSRSHGCHGKTSRLWWTGSWRRISVQSGKDGGCSQIIQDSKVRMFRFMDTSSTTWMTQIMGIHWRSSGSSWTKHIRTPACRTFFVVKKNVEVPLGLGPNWECPVVHRKQGCFLSVYVDDIKTAGKNQTMAPMWQNLMKHFDLDEPTSSLDHVCLGCTQRECKPNEIINNRATEKNTRVRKTSRKDCSMVLRHGRTCSKMCWEMLGIGEQKDSSYTKFQVLAWMINISRRSNLNRRIIRSTHTNCLEMCVLGTNW